jgi:hypothetical protein
MSTGWVDLSYLSRETSDSGSRRMRHGSAGALSTTSQQQHSSSASSDIVFIDISSSNSPMSEHEHHFFDAAADHDAESTNPSVFPPLMQESLSGQGHMQRSWLRALTQFDRLLTPTDYVNGMNLPFISHVASWSSPSPDPMMFPPATTIDYATSVRSVTSMGSSPMFHPTPSPARSPMFSHPQPTITLNENQHTSAITYPVTSQYDQTPRPPAAAFTSPVFASPIKDDFGGFDFVDPNFQEPVHSPLETEYVNIESQEPGSFSSHNSGHTRKRKSRDADSEKTLRAYQSSFNIGSSSVGLAESSASAEKKSRIGGRQQGSHLPADTAKKAKDLRNGEGSCWPCCLQRDSVNRLSSFCL